MVWGVLGDIAEWVAAGALLVVLVWAAIERGRRHGLAAQHRELKKDAAGLLVRSASTRRPTGGPPRVTGPLGVSTHLKGDLL